MSYVNPATAILRFWKYTLCSLDDECWLWLGHIGKNNRYGSLKIGYHQVKAHRFSYELHYGPIPEGLYVRHKCDNPPCVNPRHLLVGTQKDNMEDCHKRGRAHIGPHKTHCPQGHPYSEENTYIHIWHGKRGQHCKTCMREQGKKKWRKRVELLA